MSPSAFPNDDFEEAVPQTEDDLDCLPDFPFLLPDPIYTRLQAALKNLEATSLTQCTVLTEIHPPSRWAVLAIALPTMPLVVGLCLGPQHRSWLERLTQEPWSLSFNTSPYQDWSVLNIPVPTQTIDALLTAFRTDPRPADRFELMADGMAVLRTTLEHEWPQTPIHLISFDLTPLNWRAERANPPIDPSVDSD